MTREEEDRMIEMCHEEHACKRILRDYENELASVKLKVRAARNKVAELKRRRATFSEQCSFDEARRCLANVRAFADGPNEPKGPVS